MNEDMSSDTHSTLQTILTEVRGLHTEVQGLHTEVQGLHTEVRGLHTKFDRLEPRVDAVEQGLRNVQQELGNVKQELSQFKQDTSEMCREIGTRIDARSAEIRGELTTFKSRTRYEIAETRRLAHEALDLESRSTQSQIDDLNRRMSAVERRMAEKTGE